MEGINTTCDKFNKPQRSTEVRGQVNSISRLYYMKHTHLYFSACIPCLSSGNFIIAKMQFPHTEVKIAIDALECSNFSYFLLAHLPSSPSSPPLNTSPDLQILHLLDKFIKGTSGTRAPVDRQESKQGALASFLQIVSMKQKKHDREQN